MEKHQLLFGKRFDDYEKEELFDMLYKIYVEHRHESMYSGLFDLIVAERVKNAPLKEENARLYEENEKLRYEVESRFKVIEGG